MAQEAVERLEESGGLVVEKLPTDAVREENGEGPFDDAPAYRNAVYRKAMHRAESGIAERIAALLSVPSHSEEIDPESIRSQIANELAIELSEEQMEVLEGVFSLKVADHHWRSGLG